MVHAMHKSENPRRRQGVRLPFEGSCKLITDPRFGALLVVCNNTRHKLQSVLKINRPSSRDRTSKQPA